MCQLQIVGVKRYICMTNHDYIYIYFSAFTRVFNIYIYIYAGFGLGFIQGWLNGFFWICLGSI